MGHKLRGTCTTPGCKNLQRYTGSNSRAKWGSECIGCNRVRNGRPRGTKSWRNTNPNVRKSACERCGWDEAPCDVHKIVPWLGYLDGNCVTLCPNCHRVLTMQERSLLR